MNRFLFYYIVSLVLASCCSSSQENLLYTEAIYSEYLSDTVSYNIILPYGYNNSKEQFPVVYLLHGFGGNKDSWLVQGKIQETINSLTKGGKFRSHIFILPDGGNSYYINNYDSSLLYGDFFLEELIPTIDSTYRTMASKKYRSIMGLSMGGYGTIVLALQVPDKFNAVIALSAAVRDSNQLKLLPQSQYNHFLGEAYGPDLSGSDRITNHWKSHSPYCLIDSITHKVFSELNWYLSCGKDDYLLPASKALHNHLSKYNVAHYYNIESGRHNWIYWRKQASEALLFIESTYKNKEAP